MKQKYSSDFPSERVVLLKPNPQVAEIERPQNEVTLVPGPAVEDFFERANTLVKLGKSKKVKKHFKRSRAVSPQRKMKVKKRNPKQVAKPDESSPKIEKPKAILTPANEIFAPTIKLLDDTDKSKNQGLDNSFDAQMSVNISIASCEYGVQNSVDIYCERLRELENFVKEADAYMKGIKDEHHEDQESGIWPNSKVKIGPKRWRLEYSEFFTPFVSAIKEIPNETAPADSFEKMDSKLDLADPQFKRSGQMIVARLGIDEKYVKQCELELERKSLPDGAIKVSLGTSSESSQLSPSIEEADYELSDHSEL